MDLHKLQAFDRQNIAPELRTEEHFFFDKNEGGEYFAVPREFIYQNEVFELIENGGAISESAVVTNSEIGPRSMVKAGSFVINSTVLNYTTENSVISDTILENPTDRVPSVVRGSSVGAGSHIISSDIYDSDIGGYARIDYGSSVQDSKIGDNFQLGALSFLLGDAPQSSNLIGGYCVVGNNVTIGSDSTIYAGVKIEDEVKMGHSAKVEEYTKICTKTIMEEFVKIGACVRIGKESYILNRVSLEGGKHIKDRTFVYHNRQDTDYETLSTRHTFRHVLPFKHNLRAPYNTQSYQYDTYWLISDKKRPY